jgi:membrane-bound lytic murein transglycosylase MltF
VSHAGAFGLMQIMPRTGMDLQNILQLEDTRTPQNNLIAGIYYFATLVADYEFTDEDKYQFALCSYNAGLGRTIDAMSITYYFGQDYKKWDYVKENLKHLSSKSDSLHKLVWPQSKRPSYGTLENWLEPYNYVTFVMFYFEEFKKLFDSNLKDEKIKKKKISSNKSKKK